MEDNKNAYSEVIEILKLVDDEKKLEALPMEMLELIKSKANPEYKPIINKDIPLDEQNLQPETFAILNWITQKYWNEEIKQEEVEQINLTDDNLVQEIDNKEEKKVEITENIDNTKEEITNLPVLLDNLKWYEKIKTKLIELFKKIFKRRKLEETQEGNNL